MDEEEYSPQRRRVRRGKRDFRKPFPPPCPPRLRGEIPSLFFTKILRKPPNFNYSNAKDANAVSKKWGFDTQKICQVIV
jgi:hypothetical protein